MSKTFPPTQRQLAILGFIEKYHITNGYPPSLREIGAAMKIRSTNGVNDHLVAMAAKDMIIFGPNSKSRAMMSPRILGHLQSIKDECTRASHELLKLDPEEFAKATIYRAAVPDGILANCRNCGSSLTLPVRDHKPKP